MKMPFHLYAFASSALARVARGALPRRGNRGRSTSFHAVYKEVAFKRRTPGYGRAGRGEGVEFVIKLRPRRLAPNKR